MYKLIRLPGKIFLVLFLDHTKLLVAKCRHHGREQFSNAFHILQP